MEALVGEIRMFAGKFAPVGWAFCEGQELSAVDNAALFYILGDSFGGDGDTKFNLPDLRGRFVLCAGYSQGGARHHPVGERAGAQEITLTAKNLPAQAKTGATGTFVAQETGSTKDGDAISTMPPYVAINYIIALTGEFPMQG